MADVFLSYSRRDAAFVRPLVQRLEARGKDVWVDTEGIRDAEVFPAALQRAVEQSDGFVFVISPDSVASAFCEQEVEHALELNKRVVPVVLRRVPDQDVPEGIRVRNWIPADADGGLDHAVDRLVAALDTDLDWEREHTRWLVRALEWEAAGRERSGLLRGAELAAAERWLAAGADKDPGPTALEQEYVFAGRAAAVRRQRVLVGASVGVAAVSVALLIFALISRGQARSAQIVDKSRALAASSGNQLATNPELGTLLAMRAVETKPTHEALFALRQALDQSPLISRLPPAGPQPCAPPFGGPALAYSPDGTRLAEALCDGSVRLFDARTTKPSGRFTAAGGAASLAYSRDGSRLAVGTARGVEVLDARSGSIAARLPAAMAVNGVAFSPDGTRVAATVQNAKLDSALVVWPARGGHGRTLAREPPQPIAGSPAFHRVAFLPGGRTLVTGGVGGARVYDAGTGRLERTLPGTQVTDDIALSRDGRRLAVSELRALAQQLSVTPLPFASTSDPNLVTLWDTHTWRKVGTPVRLEGLEVPTVAYAPDGQSIAGGVADGTAAVWSTTTGDKIVALAGGTSAIASQAFTPDARRIATASSDGTAAVWRANSGQLAQIDPHDVIVGGGWGRDRISAAGPLGIHSWSWPSLKALPFIRLADPGAPTGSEFGQTSEDGAFAAWRGPKGIALWDVRAHRLLRRLPLGAAPSLAFSNDHRHISYVDSVGQPRIIDIATGRAVALQVKQPSCPPGWRWSSFDRSDRLLAAASFCGPVFVWDTRTGRQVSSFVNKGQISFIDFAPDGRHVAVASLDGTATLWDVRTRRPAHVLTGHTGAISLLAYNSASTLVATAGNDATARVWDAASGRVLRILHHPSVAPGVGFSPDGRYLITVDLAGRGDIWQACPACEDGKALLRLARARVTRQLTPVERATYGTG